MPQEQKLENNFDKIARSNAWLKPLKQIFCFSFKKQIHSKWFPCKIRDISLKTNDAAMEN